MSTYSASIKFPIVKERMSLVVILFLEGTKANLLMSVQLCDDQHFAVTFVGTFKNLQAFLKSIAQTEKQQDAYLAAIHCLDE